MALTSNQHNCNSTNYSINSLWNNWALPDKKCPPPYRGGRNSRLVVFDSLRPHFQTFFIQFDQIPSFCHKKSSWFPHFDTFLLYGFPGKFCNKHWHPLWGAFLIWNSPLAMNTMTDSVRNRWPACCRGSADSVAELSMCINGALKALGIHR